MAQKTAASRPRMARRDRENQLKDEVYRQMYRLEGNRPGAEMDLAIALLQGWLAPLAQTERTALHRWLQQVCPICILMIEAARENSRSGTQCPP